MSTYRIALAQYPIEMLESFPAFAAKTTSWVEEASKDGAQLLVCPEYGSMELVAFLPPNVRQDLQASLEALQSHFKPFDALYRELARKHKVHILAPSFPLSRINTATLHAPSGKS